MRKYKIATVPGDGIGPEVIHAGIDVLNRCVTQSGSFSVEVEEFDWNSENYLKRGWYIPDGGLDRLKAFDAILFGAVGSLKVPDDISLWGLRLPIVQGFDQYANVRPTRMLPGVISPLTNAAGIDWVIIRENSEGEYAGHGGRAHKGLPTEIATETAVFTRSGIERIHRFAFETARSRPRKHLTLVTKSNAMRFGMVLWDEVFFEIAKDFPDVTVDRELVDAATTRMVLKPWTLDTIVGTNLHADILSDLASALAGSLGIGATANLNPSKQFPSMFEPIHGSAFDIANKGIANPLATFWTLTLMLDHLGEHESSQKLMKAIETVTRQGVLTPDLGGTGTTEDVTRAVCDALSEQ